MCHSSVLKSVDYDISHLFHAVMNLLSRALFNTKLVPEVPLQSFLPLFIFPFQAFVAALAKCSGHAVILHP